jgi:F-type H+-transporting ATPase subunit f
MDIVSDVCFLKTSGSGEGLTPLVNFYSKLPKGPSTSTVGGIKGRFFNGKNASAAPLLATILTLFGLGYTIDYQSELQHLQLHVLFIDLVCSAVHLSKELAQFACPSQLIDVRQSITRTMRTEEGSWLRLSFVSPRMYIE